MSKPSLFIFRRDLRLTDNTALSEASRQSEAVIPCFIFDPAILARFEGHDFRRAFLQGCLEDLDAGLRGVGSSLRIFSGDPAAVVGKLSAGGEIGDVYVNQDYTPASARRDETLSRTCRERGSRFVSLPDAMLNEPGEVLKQDGTPYVVFTPYHRAALSRQVATPDVAIPGKLIDARLGSDLASADKLGNSVNPLATPGVTGARQILDGIAQLADYEDTRDFPALDATSHLSCHLRFGTCSPREAWHAIADSLGRSHPLARQLHWRDFFTQVATHHPHVFRGAFRQQYDAIPWSNNTADFDLWCEGKTGFPIVDAGMRELVTTGYMHNRVRMVTASFLVKNLHINWRWGEAFFARYLVDYDPAVNNGNWQWAASTGCDAQPYFRVFNPWRQQQRFDADATYIKRWVPELGDWPAKNIHNLEKRPAGYLRQVTDLKASAEAIKARFKAAS